MGFWDITMSESDYGLDLLGAIVETEQKATVFRLLTWQAHLKLSRQTLWKKSDGPIVAAPRRI